MNLLAHSPLLRVLTTIRTVRNLLIIIIAGNRPTNRGTTQILVLGATQIDTKTSTRVLSSGGQLQRQQLLQQILSGKWVSIQHQVRFYTILKENPFLKVGFDGHLFGPHSLVRLNFGWSNLVISARIQTNPSFDYWFLNFLALLCISDNRDLNQIVLG